MGFIAIGMTVWSQAVPNINKMSISTQMFLDEMQGLISFDEVPAPPARLTTPDARQLPEPRRPIASPDTIDGKVYIASFIRIVDESVISELEALGVEVQCKFKGGTVLTTNIPIDKIDEVAALDGVIRINVSSIQRPLTDRTRAATNVDDVLTLSNDAIASGLTQKYDGSGVILGIIDTGIDFQHKAFTDKNGNTRIKGAYCYNGSQVTADWTGSGTLPTTDDSSEDHGTHTSSIAGGSSVIVSGTNVTVTDNHANATYGGMAPGAELFLAGTQLYTTYSMNAFQRMCSYADAQGKPLVVSNSWGGVVLPNDGNSEFADILSDYFGDSHPNHIALFASGNEAGYGGFAVSGASTSANPLGTIIQPISSYYGYYHVIANAWTRATDATGIGINIYVLNSSGAIQRTYNLTTNGGSNQTVSLAGGMSGTLYVYFDYADVTTGKKQVLVYSGNSISGNSYKLAIEVYPIGGSSNIIDIWANGGYVYYDNNLTTNGHTWTKGTDDMSATGECLDPNVISVGSYVTRAGNYSNSVGDISDFSSYTLEGMGPQGTMHPWITAPGQVIISGLNHYVSSYNHGTVTVNNSSAPYGEMSGTSMATPAAAGIVALWFQAAQEVGKDLTLSEVKEIMKETAIRDSWVTTGSNRTHFGNGKIDALAGIKYILDNYGSSEPHITATPSSLTFSCEPRATDTKQVTVKGYHLTGNITATLNDPDNVYSMAVAGTNANGPTLTLNSGDVINVTYSPQAVGTHTGSITLTSPGAESVTVTLDGRAAVITEVTVCDGNYIAQTLPVLGLYHDENQHNQMIYPAHKFEGTSLTGKTIKSLTFYPTNGSITQSGTTYNFSGINFYNGSITFKLANLPSGNSGFNEDSPQFVNATLTEVKTVEMPSSANTSATTWLIELDDEFVYNGGDLLIDVSNVPGDWGYTFFVVDTINDIRPGYVQYESNSFTTDYLPKMTIVAEAPMTQGPSLSVSPAEVAIEDGTGDARSANVTVTSENLTGGLTTTASNHWSATLNQDGTQLTVTYNGKALHQVGSASVHSNADDLHASVSADYLYTGPIYILGNTSSWSANNGIQMTRDVETGIYTASLTAQNSGDGYSYVGFTKRLGSNANDWNSIEYYRFGPVSNDANWALYNQWADNRDVFCPLDTVGGYSTIQVPVGIWSVTIDSKNNQFKFTELVISSSVSPTEGTLDFGTIFTGSNSTQTITITNDGDLPFTPSLGGLSGVFSTDYVPSELAPGESVTITITYTPENSGSDSGTFTVSDGVHSYTWTLVGAAATPVIHGYVEPNDVNVNFGEKALNETYTYTVRIYNDGDLTFDPVINASGMDGVFNVTPTTGITIEAGEYYDLTVSFTPTQEGSYSSTFTVTINGEPTIVTVTGSASATAITDDIIHSNMVTVPVYKTDLDVYGPYTYGQVIADTNHQLEGNVTNGMVKVQAKNIDAITDYRLFHNAGAQNNTLNMENWASGNNESSVAYAVHNIANDNFTTYAKNENAWAQDAVYTFQNGEEEMWIDLHDNVEVGGNVDTWYVPVTVARSKLDNENTYGSRMEQNPKLNGSVIVNVGYDDSSEREYFDPVTGMKYVYVTAQANIIAEIPTIDINDHSYEVVMARAWRYYKPYIIGVGPSSDYVLELIGENTEISGGTGIINCSIGSENWTDTTAYGEYLLNEYTFCVKEGEQTDVVILARLYYKRNDVVNPASGLRLSGSDGGYFAMDGESDMPEEPTAVNEYFSDKELVDITFVNPQGMTSSRPFEGVNIVVKRYSDGSISTSKVLKR